MVRVESLEARDNRIQTTVTKFRVDSGVEYEVHYYTRFIGQSTELWIFGCGLGDQTLINQLGDGFLEHLDFHDDPELGNIMLTVGTGISAYYPYKGDHNLAWIWGVNCEQFPEHMKNFEGVQPEIILSPYQDLRDKAEEMGYISRDFYSGVGRQFRPLFRERAGLGFAGLDNKGEGQRHKVLQPAIDHGNFEWISDKPDVKKLNIDELNEWYNSKQILFGMVAEDRANIKYVPTRLLETLGSGTPLIISRLIGVEESVGFQYPYQTDSYEETEKHIHHILDNFEDVKQECLGYSRYIREHHSYPIRVERLLNWMSAL